MAKSTFPGHLLRDGSKEPAVKTLKQRLNEIRNEDPDAHQPRLPEDNQYGQLTEVRVEQFQRHHDMDVDGIVGPMTWAALFHEPISHIEKKGERAFPNVVHRHLVVCQSARNGPIRAITLHDTEGANIHGIADLTGLGNFFNVLSVQASAHVGVDAEEQSARYVLDYRKAWHCAAYNSSHLGIEQIGFASQKQWPEPQLRETARWCAYWCRKFDIPIKHDTDHGICTHADLGAAGGGHHDPGEGFPFPPKLLGMVEHYHELQG